MTLTLMLSLARALPNVNRSTKKSYWERKITNKLRGKTLGIIGVGQIGKEVIKLANNFNMKVIGYDIV